MTGLRIRTLLACLAVVAARPARAAAPTTDWTAVFSRTEGGYAEFRGSAVAPDGSSWSAVSTSLGFQLRRYSAAGTALLTATPTEVTGVAADASGNAIVVRSGSTALGLQKYSTTGSLLWSVALPPTTDTYDAKVAIDTSGSIFVCGRRWGGTYEDAWITKVGPAGAVIWTRTMDRGPSLYDRAISVVPLPDGGAFVAGTFEIGPGVRRITLDRFSGAGTVVWSASHSGTFGDVGGAAWSTASDALYVSASDGNDVRLLRFSRTDASELGALTLVTAEPEVAGGIAIDDSGTIYVTSCAALPGPIMTELRCAAIGTAMATTLWIDMSDLGTRPYAQVLSGAGVNAAGDLMVWASRSFCAWEGVLRKLTPAGTLVWSRILASPAQTRALDVRVTSNGEVMAVGNGEETPVITRYSTAGTLLGFTVPASTLYCGAKLAAAITESGSVYALSWGAYGIHLHRFDPAGVRTAAKELTGWITADFVNPLVLSITSEDRVVIAGSNGVSLLDAALAVTWTRTFSFNNTPTGVVTLGGTIFVAGRWNLNGIPDDDPYGIVAIDPAGATLWSRTLATGTTVDYRAIMTRLAVGGGAIVLAGSEEMDAGAGARGRVFKFSPEGVLAWNTIIEPSGIPTELHGIAVHPGGYLWATGNWSSPLDVGGLGTFVAALSPAGALRWTTGLPAGGTINRGRAITLGSLYVLADQDDPDSPMKLHKWTDPPPALSSPAPTAPATVSLGQGFPVVVPVPNASAGVALGLAGAFWTSTINGTLLNSGTPAPVPVLEGGSTALFTWTFTASGVGPVSMTFSVTGTELGSGLGITVPVTLSTTVQLGASLWASAAAPATIRQGRMMTVTLTVTNVGEATAVLVAPPAAPASVPAGRVVAVSGPSPAGPVTLVGGAAVTFAWQCEATGSGPAVVVPTVAGADGNAGWVLATGAGAAVTISAGASLKTRLSVSPASVRMGDAVSVSFTVSNHGDAAANALTPSLLPADATALKTTAGPSPDATALLSPHEAQTYTWTIRATRPGTNAFTATAAATDGGGAIAGTATGEVAAAFSFSDPAAIFPNPATGTAATIGFTLKEPATEVAISAYNSAWRRVWYGTLTDAPAGPNVVEISKLDEWAPGVYLVRIKATYASGASATFDPVKLAVRR